MSKLSFRARALDATKAMPIYKLDEIPDLPDFAAINRAVPQMPTGMEKEEESEHHLQRALSAQQVYGTAEALVIPVPDIGNIGDNHYTRLYRPEAEFKPPKQYVHVQAFGMDQEIPDYDMDSEDEAWLTKQTKKMEVTALQFENMMDRLEKGSGQVVVTLQEAKALLKEDDDLIISVYDYWLNKRLRMQQRLIPQVKTEKRDGSSTNDPYVAFRRRTEKMQTRKNRKNDETSYEKMLKLKRDLNKALTILELVKRREKSKKEMLQLTIEVVEKRYQMGDWTGESLKEAMAQRHARPSFVPLQAFTNNQWATKQEEGGYVRKKREYKKRKHKASTHVHAHHAQTHHRHHQRDTHHHRGGVDHSVHHGHGVTLPSYSSEVDVLRPDYSSDEDFSSPLSPSDQEPVADDDPDGKYAFKRKPNVQYHQPINDGLGNWPWCGREDGGTEDLRFRYSLTSLSAPRRCIGYARRRIGRGGRVVIDRALTDWDDPLTELDLTSPGSVASPFTDYVTHIKEQKIPYFRPRTPTEDDIALGGGSCLSPLSQTSDFYLESFHNHQEQLLAMQRHQQEQLLKHNTDSDSSFDLNHSFSSQPTSRFTLDSASARFAASAVCTSTKDLASLPSSESSMTQSQAEQPRPVIKQEPGVVASNCSNSTTTRAPASSSSSIASVLGISTPQTPHSSAHVQTPSSLFGACTSTGGSSAQQQQKKPQNNGLIVPPPPPPHSGSSPVVSGGGATQSSAVLGHTSLASALAASSASQQHSSSSSAGAALPPPSLSNGPVIDTKTSGLSTSPAATVLQLNYPLSGVSSSLLGGMTSSVTSAEGSTAAAQGVNAAAPSPVIGARAVTPTNPAVLKLGSTASQNDIMPKENHDNLNNIVKKEIVAMEVT